MINYTIIIVDNDEDEQFFMAEAFNAVGLFKIVAQLENGDELMSFLNENPHQLPDIILSDLNMPGKNGYDIITDIKDNLNYNHIPVIITSTSSTKAIIDKCLAMGATDYLVKPDTFVDYVPFVKHLYEQIGNKQLVK